MTKDMGSAATRPAVNWVTSVSGLFGTDLIASGSSSGHVQLWRLVVEGKAFSFGRGGDDSDEENGKPKSRGRLRVHHDNTKIVRIPEGEFHLVRLCTSFLNLSLSLLLSRHKSVY